MARSALYFAFALGLVVDFTYGHERTMFMDGDVILGGLFTIHYDCDTPNVTHNTIGIQRTEAMLYTIEQINNDQQLLPKIKLGARILDTCGNGPHALDLSVEEFVPKSGCGDEKSTKHLLGLSSLFNI